MARFLPAERVCEFRSLSLKDFRHAQAESRHRYKLDCNANLRGLALQHLPVIVGIGEITDRPQDPVESLEPLALMAESLRRCAQLGAASVWLGVNQENQRAQRFYAKSDFRVSGTKTFRLGDSVENDYVMVRSA